jgi:hypothetical protein
MLQHLHMQNTGTIHLEQNKFQFTRPQIWQAFVQQSVRTIAEECGIDAEFDDGLNIKEVTTHAYSLLGENGIIRAADQHACTECTQKYKKTSDVVFNDPAAVVGMDATDDNIPAMALNHEEVQFDLPQTPVTADNEMDVDDIPNIKMVVLDGVVMGPQVNTIYIILLTLLTIIIYIALCI